MNIDETINKIRKTKPVVLCLTNYVTMDLIANSLLAIGSAPIMSEHSEDIEEMVQISNALYINIGTLNDEFTELARCSIKFAKANNKPIIFDPVGSGATQLRTNIAREIANHAAIIRGNASEIMSLVSDQSKTLGAESLNKVDEAKASSKILAQQCRNIIAISGEIDFITDGNNEHYNYYGSPLMQKVTGMGCSLTAVIAAFRAVNENSYDAALSAIQYFTLCGTMAAKKAAAPGSFRAQFIDELYKNEI